MGISKNIDKIMFESKNLFVNQSINKVKELLTFLEDVQSLSFNNVFEVRRFFHSLKGTGSTLDLDHITLIGVKYVKVTDEMIMDQNISNENYQTVIDGLKAAEQELENLLPLLKNNPTELKEDEIPLTEEMEPDLDQKLKILIIEDNTVIANLLQKRFTDLHYTVQYSLNGMSGISECFKLKPHLVLLDIFLPDINGIKIISEIKTSRELSKTKIIIISALDNKETIQMCFDLGADEYVVKPFQIDVLEELVKSTLKES